MELRAVVLEGADAADIAALDDGGGAEDVRRFGEDVGEVAIGEEVFLAGGVLSGDLGGGAGEDEADVLADLGELALIAGAEAFAEADEQEQRAHAPGDAEHGEEGAQLVRPERAEGLSQKVAQNLHRDLYGGFGGKVPLDWTSGRGNG